MTVNPSFGVLGSFFLEKTPMNETGVAKKLIFGKKRQC
jgi:hypothetical protein